MAYHWLALASLEFGVAAVGMSSASGLFLPYYGDGLNVTLSHWTYYYWVRLLGGEATLRTESR